MDLVPQVDGAAVITGNLLLPLADTPPRTRPGTVERQRGVVDLTVLPLSTQPVHGWTREGDDGAEVGLHLQEPKGQETKRNLGIMFIVFDKR